MLLTEHKLKVQQLLTKHRKILGNTVQEFDKHLNNQPVLKATNLDEAITQLRCEMQRTLNPIVPEKTKDTKQKEEALVQQWTIWSEKNLEEQRNRQAEVPKSCTMESLHQRKEKIQHHT